MKNLGYSNNPCYGWAIALPLTLDFAVSFFVFKNQGGAP